MRVTDLYGIWLATIYQDYFFLNKRLSKIFI